MKLDRKHLIIIGGGVALLAIMLYMRSRSSKPAPVSDTMGTTDSGAAQAGGDAQQAAANEASDVAALQAQLAAQQGQEASDIAALHGDVSAVSSAVDQIPAGAQGPQGATGAAGATGRAGRNIVRTAAGKGKGKGKGKQHGKAGAKVSNAARHNGNHANNHHPASTAGHAVAQRSHGAPTRANPRHPSQHPVTQHAQHPRPNTGNTGGTRAPASKPPAKPRRGRR